MTVRPFIPWPDKRLRTAAEPVPEITDAVRAIWADMIDTMEALPGLGLAAPQIGVMQRLAVVDASEERGQVIRLANPKVVDRSTETFRYAEGSPNLPGVQATMDRPARVVVAYLDDQGVETRRSFENLWATSVQHQIDHLDGHLYIDRLSRTKRTMLLKKAAKFQR